MRHTAVLILLLPAFAAAEDITVLKPGPGEPSPRKLLHTQLLAECQTHFDARRAAVEALKTPADVAKRQAELRAKFVEALGGFPEKTPLNARTVGTLNRAGYRVEKVVYESRPSHHVTANLYLPDGPGPFPGVVMPVGHSSNGKAAEYMQRGAILLVTNGIAALVYDPIGQGERMQLLDKLGAPAIKGSTSEHTLIGVGAIPVGRGTASYRVWDGIRSIDYLCSRPEIDPKRIGATGCSGGGTLTSYLMALDDRVAAAAPSCYLTTLERLFATIGPQDGEQNITGQVAFGMDHADYVLMRAPRPTLICAATRDFFDIGGTWAAFREAKRVYGVFGLPERVDLLESDTPHGYPKLHREGMTRFFRRWFLGKDDPVSEPAFPIEKDRDLWCTRSGQVLEDLKGTSCFDLNAAAAAELAKGRTGKPLDLTAVRRLIGVPEAPAATERPTADAPFPLLGVQATRLVFRTADGFDLPAVMLAGGPAAPLVVYAHDGGKAADAGPGGPVEALVKAGKRVLAVDLRGWGETAPSAPQPGKRSQFGAEYKETFLALHLNRPLTGRRVGDLAAVVGATAGKSGGGVELVGVGAAGPVALHVAALLPDRVAAVTLVDSLPSWELVSRTPVASNQFAGVVPGALRVYDLPDLAGAVAPRPLAVRNPVDAVGQPLTAAAIDAEFKAVRAAYAKANAADKLTVTAGK